MKRKLQARDPILALPEHIIHEIMHHLSTKEVFQTSVLSKTWHRLRQSYPVLYFNQDFKSMAIPRRSKGWEPAKEFTERVHSSLLRFQQLDVCLQKLHICMHAFDSNVSKQLRRCIRLGLKLGVTELELDLYITPYRNLRLLPETLCSSEKLRLLNISGFTLEQSFSQIGTKFQSLRKLVLSNCDSCDINGSMILKLADEFNFLEDLVISHCRRFNGIVVNNLPRLKTVKLVFDILYGHCAINDCHDLKTAWLHGVVITEKDISRVLSGLPMLETLHLVRCRTHSAVKISGQRLKTVIFGVDNMLESIELATPSLKNFIFACSNWKTPCLINLDGCYHVQNLLLHSAVITDHELCDFVGKFPLLEYLWVSGCHKLQRLRISSEKLKRLHIVGGAKLEAIEVDTPNLYSFCVTGCQISPSSVLGCRFDVRFEQQCTEKNSFWIHELEEMLKFCFQVDGDQEVIEFLIYIMVY